MFIVVEIQTQEGGTVATLTYAYNTFNEALAKYHSILAVAATSSLPKHGAVVLRNDCVWLRGEAYGSEFGESEEEPA